MFGNAYTPSVQGLRTVRKLTDIQTAKGRSEDVAAYVPYFGTLCSATSEAEPKGVPLAAVYPAISVM